MFVAAGAKEKLMNKRKEVFVDDYIVPLVQEAVKLGISEVEITEMINRIGRMVK
jgi:DNA-binding transcriptional regulator YhcF (GntR family)